MSSSSLASIVERLQIPNRLHRAYLAEPYDGIGQYVLVTMARTSTSAAIKAKVAAGDFGGRRVFPEGTPVVIHSNRGQVEILTLGNRGLSCMFDSFDRLGVGLVATTPDNYDWNWGTGTGYVDGYTNGAEFVVDFTSTNRTQYGFFDTSNEVPPPLKLNQFQFLTRFKQDAIISNGLDTVRFLWYGPGFEQQIRIQLNLNQGWNPISDSMASLSLRSVSSDNTPFPFGSIRVNEWYILKVEFYSGEYSRLKIWEESSGEPIEWLIDLVDGIPETDVSECILWDFTNELQNGQTMNRTFDHLKIC